MTKPQQHDREAILVTKGSASGTVRSPTVVNRGVLPQGDKSRQQKAGKGAAESLEILLDAEDSFDRWDDRLLPEALREDFSGHEGEEVLWDQRLMPERLRNLLSGSEATERMADEPFRIVTQEDIDRQKAGLDPVTVDPETAATDVDYAPAFPGGEPPTGPPSGGNGAGGNGAGGNGSGDNEDFSNLPSPPEAPSPHKRLNNALYSAAYSFMGAFTAATTLTLGSAAMDQGSNSSVMLAALATGAAVPHAARIVTGATKALGNFKVSGGGKWGNIQKQAGWKGSQCRRWARAGFSPEAAQEWEAEFRGRPGLNLATYPPGGDASTVKMAKQYRDIGGNDARKLTPEDAREFIQAYMTPQNVFEWNEKYLHPSANEEKKEAFREFMLTAHRKMTAPSPEGFGPGYKSVDACMRNLCKELKINELQRWDKHDDSLMERYSRDVSRGQFADSVALG